MTVMCRLFTETVTTDCVPFAVRLLQSSEMPRELRVSSLESALSQCDLDDSCGVNWEKIPAITRFFVRCAWLTHFQMDSEGVKTAKVLAILLSDLLLIGHRSVDPARGCLDALIRLDRCANAV